MDHYTDDLELYALGMLERTERLTIDTHVRVCDVCTERLGRAEATVADLLESELADVQAPAALLARIPALPTRIAASRATSRLRTMAPQWATAAAVVFALTTGGFGVVNSQLAASLRGDGQLVSAMISGHFVHAQFRSPSGASLAAKVLYERHGRWYEILATGDAAAWRVAVVPAAGTGAIERPERFARRGDAFVLALPALGAIDQLQLRDESGRLVGSVRIPASGGR